MAVLAPYAGSARNNGGEISRLLTAAVINRGFCKLLLSNPASALANGYNGESFRLGGEVESLVLSIRACSLSEFASQLAGARPNERRAKERSSGKYAFPRRS